MKRWAWLLLLAALAAPGCLAVPEVKEPPPPPVDFKAAAPPPVQPDQVTEANAEDILHQLRDEIDRETYAPPAGRH